MTASRRTVGLVALGAAAVLGAGAGVTTSLTSWSTPAPSGARGAGGAAADLVGTDATVAARAGAPAGGARPATVVDRVSAGSSPGEAQPRARRAAVVAAVRKRYPHARILAVAPHRDGTWLVVLTLDHRAGTVTVGRHLQVGAFHPLPGRPAPPRATPTKPTPATPTPATPTPAAPGTGTVGGDGAASGQHW